MAHNYRCYFNHFKWRFDADYVYLDDIQYDTSLQLPLVRHNVSVNFYLITGIGFKIIQNQ